MGKAQKKKKTQAWRHNPIRVPDSHLPAGKGEGSADPSKEKQTVPVLNKLKSPEYADRTWACAAICNLIQNDPATRRLFQAKNVVGELIERLSDDVDEVVVEASGALRNLAIDGGHELCAEMFNKGVMAHIIVLVQKISGTIDSVFATKPDTQLTDQALQSRKHLLGLTENILSLIWSMGETSHKSLEAVNAANVEGLLVKVLDGRATLGPSVAVAAAQAMYSLSQDNFDFKRKMNAEPAALQVLVQTARDPMVPKKEQGKGKGKKEANGDSKNEEQDLQMLLKLLVCGVLRNVVDAGSEADEQINIVSITNEVALPIINDLLNLDSTRTVARVFELVREIPSQTVPQAGKELKTDHRSAAEVELESIERSLNTVVVGLEILTGICAGIEESEEVEEPEAVVEEDDEMEEDVADEDLIALGNDTNGETTDPAPGVSINTPVTLSHLLQTLSLPQRLSTLSSLTPLSFPPSSSTPSPHPPTTSLLSTIHLRALEALNNLLLTTVAGNAYQPGSIPSQGVWDTLFKSVQMIVSEPEVISAKGHEMRGEVLEMTTGCLWGMVKLASDEINVEETQVKLLIDILPSLKSDSARARVIDTLALLASRANVSNEENKAIGDFLITSLSTPPPASLSPELLVSVLNAIIDIHADEDSSYDINFVKSDHLKALSSQVNRVRNDMKKIDRRKDRELRARGEETYENLVAFIKYRRSLGR